MEQQVKITTQSEREIVQLRDVISGTIFAFLDAKAKDEDDSWYVMVDDVNSWGAVIMYSRLDSWDVRQIYKDDVSAMQSKVVVPHKVVFHV